MRKILIIGLMLAVSLTACSKGSSQSSASLAALQKTADLYAIDQIEKTWHKASSTKDVNLMMTLWAPDATFTFGSTILTGTKKIRNFFTNEAAPFQSGNNWVSDTPA